MHVRPAMHEPSSDPYGFLLVCTTDIYMHISRSVRVEKLVVSPYFSSDSRKLRVIMLYLKSGLFEWNYGILRFFYHILFFERII